MMTHQKWADLMITKQCLSKQEFFSEYAYLLNFFPLEGVCTKIYFVYY